MKSSKLVSCPQTVLAAELVEAWNAALAIANDVERRDVDLLRRRMQPIDLDVLHEPRVFCKREHAEALAPHRQRPVRQSPIVHEARRAAAERLDHRNLRGDRVGRRQLAILEQVGHEGVQTIDR